MKKSVKFKMVFIFSVLLLTACTLISLLVYQFSMNTVKTSVGQQAAKIVESSVGVINLNKYKEITPELGETGYYKELRKELNTIREMNELVYLYTMSRSKKGDNYKYYYMVDGMPLESEDASALGEEEEDVADFPAMIRAFESGKTEYEISNDEEYGALISVYVPMKNENGGIIGILGADIDATHVYDAIDSSKAKITWITIVILLIGMVIVYLFADYLTKPLKRLTENVRQVGRGDLSVVIETTRTDEIGALTKTFGEMVNELKKVIQGIDTNSSQLIETSNQLLHNSNKAGEASNQITNSMQEVSAGSYTQYKSSEESAETLEQLSKGIRDIAATSSSVAELSTISLKYAEQGNNRIENVINQMTLLNDSVKVSASSIKELEEQSNEISVIIKIIRDISAQTNLLALNAAIEAARAGENGKGFAVVADEVRKLAEQSEDAAKNISTLISNMKEDTNRTVHSMKIVNDNVTEGITAVEEAGDSFVSILDSIQNVVAQIKGVSLTSEEMSAYSEEIATAVMETTVLANQAADRSKDVVGLTVEQENYINEILFSITSLKEMAANLDGLIKKFVL
nr:methyl-accepting chemotaxis protein [Bacillus timonensis]